MKAFKWIALSAAAIFTTGCAVEVRPHHSHSRVYYDTWDYCEPSTSIYVEGFYSTHGHYGHHRGYRGGYGKYKRRCR